MRRILGNFLCHSLFSESAAISCAVARAPHRVSSSSGLATDDEKELEKDREALRKYSIFAGVAVLCAGTLWYGSERARKRYFGSQGSTRVSVETRGRPALGGPFVLVNTDGEPVSQAEFLGSWTFFYFGFTHCPEICPVELNRMSKVIDTVRAKRPRHTIMPLFVSCDPRRDSLDAINEYLAGFHESFVGLVGTPKQVSDACKSYRIYYSLPSEEAAEQNDYLIDHSIAIFLFDPKGRFVDFFGSRYDENEIAQRVLGYMDQLDRDPEWTNWPPAPRPCMIARPARGGSGTNPMFHFGEPGDVTSLVDLGSASTEPITCFATSPPSPEQSGSPSRVVPRYGRMVGRGLLTNVPHAEDGAPLAEVHDVNTHGCPQRKSPQSRLPIKKMTLTACYDGEFGAGRAGRFRLNAADRLCSADNGARTPGSAFDSAAEPPPVPRSEYERVERERCRYAKMYEHQKSLYEEVAARQEETYKELQEKIFEVVALSTRNEENKRLIRQLKSEMSDNRARVVAAQNRVLEEAKLEKSAKEWYEQQLRESTRKHESLMEQQNTRVTSLENLLNDLTTMRGEGERLQVSQLDALLKAAYAKNSALFGDMLRQGKQIDVLFRDKASLEQQLERERCEKRAMEAQWADERYHMLEQMAGYTAQIAEQQRSILSLRQRLAHSSVALRADLSGTDDDGREHLDEGTRSASTSSSDSNSDGCVEGGDDLDEPWTGSSIEGRYEVQRRIPRLSE